MSKKAQTVYRQLSDVECRYYRDLLRAARYAALANAEGFDEICFALEALGLGLMGKRGDLGKYKKHIEKYAEESVLLHILADAQPTWFKTFNALYEAVRSARNDSMHSGSYARHATAAAIELSIALEESIMSNVNRMVVELMVKSPITVEPWQPVAHARNVMLTNSFSFLPLWFEGRWWLLSEIAMAKFLNSKIDKKLSFGLTIETARNDHGLDLVQIEDADLCTSKTTVEEVLSRTGNTPTLWLVTDENRKDYLAGVLSPFELM